VIIAPDDHGYKTIDFSNAITFPSWFNYRTGEYESRTGAPTGDEIRDYLPQYDAAWSLFQIRRALGDDEMEAMKQVLLAVIGETDTGQEES